MFGSAVCDLWNSIDVHASTVSTLHLCAISFDRFFAIVKPFDYDHFMNTYSAMGMITAAWLCPAAISFVPIFLGWYTTHQHLEVGLAQAPDRLHSCFLSETERIWRQAL